MKEYDVLVFETFGGLLDNSSSIGNLFAEFSDHGGGILCCAASNCLKWGDGVLNGLFQERNYHPLNYSHHYWSTKLEMPLMGTIFEPWHPVSKEWRGNDFVIQLWVC